MSSNALPSQGMKLQIGTGSPVSYSDIPEIRSFNGPGGSAAVIDTTDLASTAKEKRMGLQDEGQLSFEINFIPTNVQHVALRAAKASGAVTPFKLIFTDSENTEWSFNAFVLSVPIGGGVDNVVVGTVTLEITGSISEA